MKSWKSSSLPGALSVEREAGLLQGVEVTPDRADGALELAGGAVDRHALGPVDHLDQPPLPG